MSNKLTVFCRQSQSHSASCLLVGWVLPRELCEPFGYYDTTILGTLATEFYYRFFIVTATYSYVLYILHLPNVSFSHKMP